MDKIIFGTKKSKVKTFNSMVSENTADEKKPAAVPSEILIKTGKSEDIKVKRKYKNSSEIFRELNISLTNRYNIDDVSIYQITLSSEKRLIFKNVFGAEISKYQLEKYYGFNQPIIITNAAGFVDNPSHRARLIEHYEDYCVIISSSAFETFKSEFELEKIRSKINAVFKEVEKL